MEVGRLTPLPTPCMLCLSSGFLWPHAWKPHPLASGSRPAPLACWNLYECWRLVGTERNRRILYLPHPFSSLPTPTSFPSQTKKKKPSLLKKQMLSSIHFYKQIPEGINNLQIAKSEQSVGSGRAPRHKQIDLGYHPHLLTYSYLIHFWETGNKGP